MEQPRHRFPLRVFADYHQFYVWDPALSQRSAPEDWSDADIANRAKVARGVVVICPVRNKEVPVDVEIWDAEPAVDLEAWQHAVLAPLATMGEIELHECTGGVLANTQVAPGDYSVRALYRGLDSLSEDGLDGNDYYLIQIWKSAPHDLRVLRNWADST